MLVLAVTAALGLVSGGAASFVVHRWWRVDPGAPRIQPATVSNEVGLHPRLARWLRARLDPTVVTGSLLTAAAVIVVVGVGAVGAILMMVRAHSGFADFDISASRWGARHAVASSTRTLRWLTQLGGAVVLLPVTAAVAAWELRRTRRWSVVGFLAVAVGGQFLVANLVKSFVDRTRPDFARLTGFSGTSFPSGHATAAAAAFAALALVLGRNRTRSTKAALGGVAVGSAVMVAASRVLLGVHWLTDVTAGLCLGWAWFALSSMAFGGRLLHFGAPVEVAEQAVARMESTGSGSTGSDPPTTSISADAVR